MNTLSFYICGTVAVGVFASCKLRPASDMSKLDSFTHLLRLKATASETIDATHHSRSVSENDKLWAEYNYMPPGYPSAAVDTLLVEVRKVIEELKLDEPNEITRQNLKRASVLPPKYAKGSGMFGHVATSNYVYSASKDMKLSYIDRTYRDTREESLELDEQLRQGVFPMSELRTNNAVVFARDLLMRAQMDVARLDRDARVEVLVRRFGKGFVPMYLICWKIGDTTVARVQFFEPSGKLMTLRVNDAKYNLRTPLTIPKPEDYGSPEASKP